MKTKGKLKRYFFLFGVLLCLPIYAQNTTIVEGTVLDETGGPLPGVSVVIKNTTKGAVTDFDGHYSIETNPNDTLIFSYLGFKTQEISVDGRSGIDITMREDFSALDEVVVIGYGTSTRRDVTGAISSVSGEDLEQVPVANAAQALQGKMAGVNVTAQDGRPGAEISIRVRGGGSISQSNQPLFIVDGFPVSSISNIPGSQIQSIDVLKDASSTAIYGARGANGVIMVTTKSGSAGKLSVTYDGYTQVNTPTDYLPVMSSYDYLAYNWAYGAAISDGYADAWEQLWAIGRYEGTANPEGIDHYRNVASEDFSKQVYNTSFSQNHNVNVSSGTEKTKYNLALSYRDDEGMKLNSGYTRTYASFKLQQKLGEKLTLDFDTRYSQEKTQGNEGTSSGGGSILSSAYWFRPIATDDILGILDPTVNTQLGDYDNILQDLFSPVRRISDRLDNTTRYNLVGNTSLEWKITNGLTATTALGLSTSWSTNKRWEGPIYSQYMTDNGTPTFGGDAVIRSSKGWNYRWANTLNYEFQNLGDNHKLSILGGMEVLDSDSEYIEVWGNKFPASFDSDRAWANMDSYTREEGIINGGLSSNYGTPNRLNSYFARLNYTLLDRYLFTGSFRADGSSRFAPDNRWGYFPAGAFAWRISEEGFLRDSNWLDDLKLRISYGSVGSDGISAELWKQSWAPGTDPRYSINEILQQYYQPASPTIANPDLKWETTITRNIGLDFSMFENRLHGSVDVYKNSVKDLLLLTPVSSLSGFSFTYDNIGATSNKGVEVVLGGDLVRSENFNLHASMNFAINRGNVDELDDGINGNYDSGWGGIANNPRSGDYVLKEGQPVGLIRGWIHEGWYTTDDFDYDPSGNGTYTLKPGIPDIASGYLATVYGTTDHKPGDQTAYPGVQKVKDISGPDGTPDGVIDENDLTVVGNTNPKSTGGFNLGGNYKGFDFSMDFYWSLGNDIYNAEHLNAYLGNKEAGLYRNRYQELAGSYKIYDIVDGQLTSVVDPDALDALNANASTYLPYAERSLTSTFGVEDGSFLRLNTLVLGYSLPLRTIEKFGVNRLRFYGSVYNVFTLTDYSGLDPEVNTDPNRNDNYPTPGLDYGTYPRPRSFALGINIEF